MVIVSVLGFFVVIFLVLTIAVAIAWMAFVKRSSEAGEAGLGEGEAGFEGDSVLFREERFSTLNFWQNLLARFDFVDLLRVRLAQADLEWSVGRVTLVMLLCGTVVGLIVSNVLPAWAALAAGIGAAFAPYGHILRLRETRFRKFREAFPDVLDSLARALRAGYPISAAFDLVARDIPEPLATEMRRVSAEANLGMGWQRALEKLGERMPLLEVNLFAAAVTLHARTGGKLNEVLSDLANTMRESLALRGEVRALAAHGKLTGAVLTFLPIAIGGMMLMVAPGYVAVLYTHPTGKSLIAAALICLILAHFVIRKLVDIKL